MSSCTIARARQQRGVAADLVAHRKINRHQPVLALHDAEFRRIVAGDEADYLGVAEAGEHHALQVPALAVGRQQPGEVTDRAVDRLDHRDAVEEAFPGGQQAPDQQGIHEGAGREQQCDGRDDSHARAVMLCGDHQRDHLLQQRLRRTSEPPQQPQRQADRQHDHETAHECAAKLAEHHPSPGATGCAMPLRRA